MELFLDTANIEEIIEARELGVISGITTNPSILSKKKRTLRESIMDILSVTDGTVCAEVLSLDAMNMVREARDMASWNERIVIKIPMIPEGLKAVKALKQLGVTTAVTLVYSPAQAVLAAKAGASFVAPFIARSYDAGFDGITLISEIRHIFDIHAVETKILAASIRTVFDALQALRAGADILTLPYGVLMKMAQHSLTDATLGMFMDDWSRMEASLQ